MIASTGVRPSMPMRFRALVARLGAGVSDLVSRLSARLDFILFKPTRLEMLTEAQIASTPVEMLTEAQIEESYEILHENFRRSIQKAALGQDPPEIPWLTGHGSGRRGGGGSSSGGQSSPPAVELVAPPLPPPIRRR